MFVNLTSALENTPEQNLIVKKINNYPVSWSFISKYFKFVPSSFLETFTATKLIQLTFSNVR